MAYRVELSADAERDLEIILEFLVDSYTKLGDDTDAAFARAAARLEAIRSGSKKLATAPHRGTLRDSLLPGLRHVTIGRAIFWFDVDEAASAVRILAVFFGGQDHQRRMLARLLRQASRTPGPSER